MAKSSHLDGLESFERGVITYHIRSSSYDECSALLANKKKNDRVLKTLESLAERRGISLTDIIGDYLTGAIKKEPDEAREWFAVFQQYLPPDRRLYFALDLEGYEDLKMIALSAFLSECPPDLRFVKSIRDGFIFDTPVLIIGETGTSKEAVARVIHNLSAKRYQSPFKETNCAAIPETLLESELFGFEKGSHSQAGKMKKGLLENAPGGTIFLDEIGKMPLQVQAKVLKVIEEKKMYRVGSEETEPISIDVRFVAATQPNDLENILPDLLYRMGYPDTINMPTLGERLKYVPRAVLQSSIRKAGESLGLKCNIQLVPESIKAILEHEFKGNYRELENILRYAIKAALSPSKKRRSQKEWERIFKNKNNDKLDQGTDERQLITIKLKHFCELINTGTVPDETKNDDLLDGVEQIPVKDIINYADSVASTIIKRKIVDIKKGGLSFRRILVREGLSEKEYQNLTKKIRLRTGKTLREIKAEGQ
jgi:transcriptional regulator with PAS, ATPase and Fis domain